MCIEVMSACSQEGTATDPGVDESLFSCSRHSCHGWWMGWKHVEAGDYEV